MSSKQIRIGERLMLAYIVLGVLGLWLLPTILRLMW